jgi:hypothetical protein
MRAIDLTARMLQNAVQEMSPTVLLIETRCVGGEDEEPLLVRPGWGKSTHDRS